MRKYLPTAILIFIFMVCSSSFAATKTPVKKIKSTKPAVTSAKSKPVEWAAKVNDDILPMEWYDKLLEATKNQLSKEMSLEAAEEKGIIRETKKSILEQMIESAILLQWAEREGIEVQPTSVKFRIAELKKQFPSSAEFHKSLAERGMSAADLDRDIKKQIITDKLIQMKYKTLAVSDEEIKSFYDKNLDLYQQKEKVHLKQEFFDNLTDAESEKIKLDSVKQFDGEDIGLIEKDQLPVYNDASLFKLKEGQISDLVSGEAGYYIFKVEEHLPAKETKFSDAKDSIRKFLLHEKARTQFLKDLQEEKANAKIILNENLQSLF